VLERLIDPTATVLSVARLREHVRRLERAEVLDPFLGLVGTGHEGGSVAKLADALALVRWWR
jgi:hypothetical protein